MNWLELGMRWYEISPDGLEFNGLQPTRSANALDSTETTHIHEFSNKVDWNSLNFSAI